MLLTFPNGQSGLIFFTKLGITKSYKGLISENEWAPCTKAYCFNVVDADL